MMDRRNFIGNLLAAGAGFMILPPASHGRVWKATRPAIQRCSFQCFYEDMPLMIVSDGSLDRNFRYYVKPFHDFEEVFFHERES